MIARKTVKIVGLAATIVSAGATLVTSWAAEKKMDDTIARKIAEALKATGNESK